MRTASLITATFVTSFLLLPSSVVFAQTSSPSPTPTVREKVREKVIEKREENRVKIADHRADRLRAHCDVLTKHFTNMFTKIQSRITFLKGEGKDTTSAETSLTEAKTSLASAQALCTQAANAYDAIPAEGLSTQNSLIREAKALAKKAHDAFVETHKLTAATLRTLANIQGKKLERSPKPSPSPKASPTVKPTASPSPSPSPTT